MISVIIPAHNEAETLPTCLAAIAAAAVPTGGAEVIVVANGCTDDTAAVARAMAEDHTAMPYPLRVIELRAGGKIGALNAGDAAASGEMRAYLDADVIIAPQMLTELSCALSDAAPRYASGTVVIPESPSALTRAFARFYRTVPFLRDGVPGCGLYAVNRAGRARWKAFPDVIADDTFVRLNFTAAERVKVAAPYDWPLVSGFGNLVKVRRRQDAGVAEIAAQFPELLQNDDKLPYRAKDVLRNALHQPFSFAIYVAVRLAGKLGRNPTRWSRGR